MRNIQMSQVTLPEHYYCGMRPSSQGAPLGFITPDGNDSASLKRKQTVDNWVKQRYYTQKDVKTLAPVVLKNVPLSGYKLTSDIRNTNYGGYDKWRILDPRGFELEITSGNLASLINYTTIEQGEIHGDCIWGRFGSNNVLLSVNSDDYKEALAATVVKNSSESWKNVKPGYKIMLQNGKIGIWLGKMYLVQIRLPSDNEFRSDNMLFVTDYKINIMAICDETTRATNKTILYLSNSPKLSQILERNEINQAEAEKLANQYIQSGVRVDRNSGYENVMFMTFSKPDVESSTKFELIPITNITSFADLQNLCQVRGAPITPSIFIDDNIERRVFGRVHCHFSNKNNVSIMQVIRSELDNNRYIRGPWRSKNTGQYYGSQYTDCCNRDFNVNAEYFNLKVKLKTELNEFESMWY